MDEAVEEVAATTGSSGGRGSVRLRGRREVGAGGDGVGAARATGASSGAGVRGGDGGRGAACPDEDGAVGSAGDEESPILTAMVGCQVAAENAAGGTGEDADSPDGIGVAVKGGFGVDAAAFPDSDAAVGATAEDPAVADGTTAVAEGLVDGRGGEAEDGTVVAAVCHLAFQFQVI